MMMATMPSTTTTAGLAPLRVSTLVSRAANCPPVEACSTHEDHASPALSSSDGSSTPTAEVAAMTTSPEPTSMSGFALRVSAIRPPAMITPSTATATASGRIHCWSWPTAGSPARSGDGTCTHQVTVCVTIQVIPDWTALAIPLSAPDAAAPATAPTALWATRQLGAIRTGHISGPHPCPGKTVYPPSEDSSDAESRQLPPGGAITFQSVRPRGPAAGWRPGPWSPGCPGRR